MNGAGEPPAGCSRCPRLVAFRRKNARAWPDWHNGPVGSFGTRDAEVLIVGLAPGLKGANRTGRAFTGDFSGEVLYGALAACGFADGCYRPDPPDDLSLRDCLVTNAVRCVPPRNRPTPQEIARCRPYLAAVIRDLPRLRVVLALGRIAHESTLRALACRVAAFPFSHGAQHEPRPGLALFDSYHCSRYNVSTGRLKPEMLLEVLEAIRRLIRER